MVDRVEVVPEALAAYVDGVEAAAGVELSLEHQYLQPRPSQVCGTDQALMATTDDDPVELPIVARGRPNAGVHLYLCPVKQLTRS